MYQKALIAFAVVTFAQGSWAAVSADEAKQLGTTLTPVGAEKLGNKDGTIPEWKGGLVAVPEGFKKGSGIRLDPYASEKPRLVISSKNVTEHSEKLTAGTQELFRRYPGSMRMDVYPTHRTMGFPKQINDNTIRNATNSKSVNDGLGLIDVLPGYPFPIPKSGNEAMWNHQMRYQGIAITSKVDNWNVDASGVTNLAMTAKTRQEFPLGNSERSTPSKPAEVYWKLMMQYQGPARRAGEALISFTSLDSVEQPSRAYQYLPGQRRVKMAPDVAHDTPNPGTAGMATYDDGQIFNGPQDRFNWKLIGKKEMYIPYNSYRVVYASNPAEVIKPGHINPDLERWELHRVWVVEATLKPGKRHVYAKRVFYLDEDSWAAVASDQYDANGKLFVSGFSHPVYAYDNQSMIADSNFMHYNFATGGYTMQSMSGHYAGQQIAEPLSDGKWSPEALAGSGVR